MTNDYFNHDNRLSRNTLARAEEVNAIADAIVTGLDKLPDEAELKQGRTQYGTDAGAANAFDVTLPYPPTVYTTGMLVSFAVNVANTGGACTINLRDPNNVLLGVKAVVRSDLSNPVAGDFPAGSMPLLRYDGTRFRIIGGQLGDATAAAASAAAAAASATAAQTAETNAETAEAAAEAARDDFLGRYVISASDPGAIGAGRLWFDTASGALKVRNTGNTAWDVLAIPAVATASSAGIVELLTAAEAAAGTDATRVPTMAVLLPVLHANALIQ